MPDKDQTPPTILVVFGITGDLAQRKLLPAIYHLFKDGFLNSNTRIIGTSRRSVNLPEFMKDVELCVLEADNVCDPTAVKLMRSHMEMLQFDPSDPKAYEKLKQLLDEIETEAGVCFNRLFYLSLPPKVYSPVVKALGDHGLSGSCQHGKAASRLLVEKPFGSDLASAQQLIDETVRSFKEEQIFRIDHYLAKETTQNILTFRAFNPMFADLWNDRHVEKIDITATEKIGIEGRADFYEGVGALRDVVQSHLLQLLAVATMQVPGKLHDDSKLHAARQNLLDSLMPDIKSVVRGQYEGYKEEVKNEQSTTETFVSLRLNIDNEQWKNTIVQITTGKGLKQKKTEVVLTFRKSSVDIHPNTLTFRIQPNEGIGICLSVKKPGFERELESALMDFRYHETFGAGHHHPDAHEHVLVDAIRGDRMLFTTSRDVLASWRVLQPILDDWQHGGSPLQTYTKGTDGPAADKSSVT